MPWTRRMRERDGHRATTATLQAVYPFVAEGGLGGRGTYIGRDLYGGSFCFDAFTLYADGVLSNPNVLVIGAVGSAKSSLVKTFLLRQAVFGRQAWVVDPKGEYGPLARALGTEPIRLAPGAGVRLNPLSPRAGWEAQLSLLLAVASAAIGRPLIPDEHAALREALAVLDRKGQGEPTLPQVVKLLLAPTGEMATRLATTVKDVARGARPAALGLQRLCEGELRGMFDGPTTPSLDTESPAVVLDLSAVYHSGALGILMTCAAAWQRATIAERHARADAAGLPAPKVINVADEAWKIIAVPGIGDWLQDSFKRSRAYGVQNLIVLHRLSDLSAAGESGSRDRALAEGLLSDAQTRIVYCQYEDELPRTRELLGLSSTEARIVGELDPGVALWKVGRRSFLVQHRLSSYETALVDTDARMLDGRAGR
jgi:type IV secretory pathway VirB4 component